MLYSRSLHNIHRCIARNDTHIHRAVFANGLRFLYRTPSFAILIEDEGTSLGGLARDPWAKERHKPGPPAEAGKGGFDDEFSERPGPGLLWVPGEAADNAPDLDPGAFSRLRLHVRWCPRRVRVCAALTAALSAAVPLRTVSTCAHFLFGRWPFKLLLTRAGADHGSSGSSELGADAPVTKVLRR